MRSIKWAVAAVALSGLTGCFNSDPDLYRVALSQAPVPLPSTCYRSGNVPANPQQPQSNLVDATNWVLWDGVDNEKYLDAGTNNLSVSMGDAPNINLDVDTIQGAKNDDGKWVFATEATRKVSDTETRVTGLTYTFDKLGQTAEGTLSLRSSCTGSGCAGGVGISCEFSVRFAGRRIDGDRFISAGSAP